MGKNTLEKKTLHVINGTHWDREWLYPFAAYFKMFVRYTDSLINIMESNPDFKYYLMDGQVICVEDYLDVYPEKKERIRKLVKQKRIFLGPWYTLPDMPLIHGEAIIRNLLTGIQVSNDFGGAMLEGFTPCSNGNIAQLPQIYNGFGISSAIIYKGIAHARTPKEFFWQSPDGSELLTIHLSARYGRAAFYALLYHEVIADVIHDIKNDNWMYDVLKENWTPFRICGQEHYHPCFYSSLSAREGWHEKHLEPYLQKLRESASLGAATSELITFNGHDHSPPFPITPKLIKAADNVFPDLDVIESNIPAFFAAIRNKIGRDIPLVVGEIRDSKKIEKDRELLWATLSAHMDVKSANRATEHLLIDKAEPSATLAWLFGAEYPSLFLQKAWKLLLANHAHDSIDGCSVNKAISDVMNRFTDSQTFCEGILRDACAFLLGNDYAGGSKTPPETPSETPYHVVTVFNFSPYKQNVYCDVDIDFFGEGRPERFNLACDNGLVITPDVTFKYECDSSITGTIDRQIQGGRYRFRFEVNSVNPTSWVNFKVIPVSRTNNGETKETSLAAANNILENDYLKVTFTGDGGVNVLHKATDKEYSGLHYFESIDDNGDPWRFKPVGERVYSKNPVVIKLIENGFWSATIQIRTELAGREEDTSEKYKDSKDSKDNGRIVITSNFTLTRFGRYLKVQTIIDNNRCNNRLRVCFPTGIVTDKTYAGGQFQIDERPTHLPDMSEWIEPVDGYPNFGFCGLSNQKEGLAILNSGLPEYFISGPQKDILVLTLLRSTMLKTWPDDIAEKLSDSAQLLGRNTFHYAIYPHTGGWEKGEVLGEYRQFASPPVCCETVGRINKCSSEGLFQIAPAVLQVSCFKKAENESSLLIRVWNPTDKPIEGKIKLGFEFDKALYVDYNESPLDSKITKLKQTGNNSISFIAGPNKILSFMFQGIIKHH